MHNTKKTIIKKARNTWKDKDSCSINGGLRTGWRWRVESCEKVWLQSCAWFNDVLNPRQ